MSKKIILFLSDLKTGPRAVRQTYSCPGGSQAAGVQTNEAPVRYLLSAHLGVKEVLCVVTPVGRETLPEMERIVREAAPAVTVTGIPFEEGEDFSAGPLAAIMGRVRKGDEILLELTGGLRDAVMQLLLTSRALSYSGIPTAGAVYANYNAREIVDCSRLIRLFDLVGGMQELTSFGSVKALRAYYAGAAEPEVRALLEAMEALHEDITLCRTRKLEGRIAAFNAAMEGAEGCADPLLRALLPAFHDKFGKKLNVPGLIRWCVGSDMLQQALTIYKERIPGYILGGRRDELIALIPRERLRPGAAEWYDQMMREKRDYETGEEVLFHRSLLNLGKMLSYRYPGRDPAVLTLEHLEELAERSDYFTVHCSIDQLRDILMDYRYIRMLRNMVNHANEQGSGDQRELMDYLAGRGYRRLEEVGAQDIRDALEKALTDLKSRPKKSPKSKKR